MTTEMKSSDCGEAGCAEGRCGTTSCLPSGRRHPIRALRVDDVCEMLVEHGLIAEGYYNGDAEEFAERLLAALASATSQQEPVELKAIFENLTCDAMALFDRMKNICLTYTAPPVQQEPKTCHDLTPEQHAELNKQFDAADILEKMGWVFDGDRWQRSATPVQQGPMGREGCNYMCMPGKVCRKCGHIHTLPLTAPPVQQEPDICGTCDGRGCPVCKPVPSPYAAPVQQAEPQAVKDAERYRWIRDCCPGESFFDHTPDKSAGGDYVALYVDFDGEHPGSLDAVVDAAIAATKKDTP